MMSNKAALILTTFIFTFSGIAYAEQPTLNPVSPIYISVFGGTITSENFAGKDTGGNRVVQTNNVGYTIGLAAGYTFKNNFRGEAALSRFYSTSENLKYANVKVPTLEGSTSATSLMFNGYYDFTLLSQTIYPYIGLGAGITRIDNEVGSRSTNYEIKGTKNLLAYQAIIGLGYRIDDQLSLGIDYRHFGTARAEMQTRDVNDARHNVKDFYHDHLVSLVIKYQLEG